jgi:hypothetical protein
MRRWLPELATGVVIGLATYAMACQAAPPGGTELTFGGNRTDPGGGGRLQLLTVGHQKAVFVKGEDGVWTSTVHVNLNSARPNCSWRLVLEDSAAPPNQKVLATGVGQSTGGQQIRIDPADLSPLVTKPHYMRLILQCPAHNEDNPVVVVESKLP